MFDCSKLTDGELIERLATLARDERHNGAIMVAHLIELEDRSLHEEAGYTNLFTYCTGVLGLAQTSAYKRIRAVEAARRHREILEMLADGRLHLEALATLSPCLDRSDYQALLHEACGKSRREVESLVASRIGRPEKSESIRPVRVAAPQAAPVEGGRAFSIQSMSLPSPSLSRSPRRFMSRVFASPSPVPRRSS